VIGCLVLTLVHYGPGDVRRNLKRTIPIAMCVGLALEVTFNLSDVSFNLLDGTQLSLDAQRSGRRSSISKRIRFSALASRAFGSAIDSSRFGTVPSLLA